MCGLLLHLNRRPSWSEFRGNNGATPTDIPSHPHSTLQYLTSRTQTPSSALGAPPTGNSPLLGENRTCHLHTSGTFLHTAGSLLPRQPHLAAHLAVPSLSSHLGPKHQMQRALLLLSKPLATLQSEPASLSREVLQLQ